MRILVTGGAGFIGSNLVRHALAASARVEVAVLDALTYAGHRSTLADVLADPRVTFVAGDVRDPVIVDELVATADAVVHLAAETHVDRSIDEPAAFLTTNAVGSGVVFDACRRHGIARVLHVSTDEVYGSVPVGAAVETDPLAPNSPYAASKAAADLLARAYAVTYDVPIAVIRPANTIGPFQLPEKAVPRFVTNLLDGEDLPLYGDGSQVRDWTHVRDTVAGQWLVLTEGTPGDTYNLGAGNHCTNRQLAEALLARFGLEGPAAAARITPVADRPGHDQRYAVDTTRIRALGWAPAYDLDRALDATLAWYREHEAWWRPLRSAGLAVRHGRRST
jgi:dTDP-glucose 4,6-dehydratase